MWASFPIFVADARNKRYTRTVTVGRTGAGKSGRVSEDLRAVLCKILCFISGIIKSDDEAEDLCQEVFVKIWINRANFVDVRNLGVYLYVLSRNLTYNYLESKQTSQSRMEEQPFDEEDSHSPLDDLVAKDMQLLIDMVVEGMPSQRKSFIN